MMADEEVLKRLQQGIDPDVGEVLDVLDALRFYDPADESEPRLPGTLERDGILALARIQDRLTALAEELESTTDSLVCADVTLDMHRYDGGMETNLYNESSKDGGK